MMSENRKELSIEYHSQRYTVTATLDENDILVAASANGKRLFAYLVARCANAISYQGDGERLFPNRDIGGARTLANAKSSLLQSLAPHGRSSSETERQPSFSVCGLDGSALFTISNPSKSELMLTLDQPERIAIRDLCSSPAPETERLSSKPTSGTITARNATFAGLCEQFADVLTPYLDFLVRTNKTLDPRGMGKDLRQGALELDEVYVSLAVERKARQEWESDLREALRETGEDGDWENGRCC